MAEPNYHNSSYEDLQRLIWSEVLKACKVFGLSAADYGEDLAQEAWVIVLRKLPVYRDMGYKVTTYLFPYIRRDVRGAAQKVRRHVSTQTPSEAEYLDSFVDDPGELWDWVEWEDVDPLVILKNAGYTDKEIAELTGEQNISRRRQQAMKELADA